MEFLKIVGIAIITVVISLLLKKHHQEYAILAAVTGGSVLLLQILLSMTPVLNQLSTWLDRVAVDTESFSILLRAMGICFLTQFASDTCRDSGESSLGAKVELAGKTAIVLLALPLLRSIAETALSLAGGAL